MVDLNVNPSNPVIGALGRSFSADPEVVADQSFEVIAPTCNAVFSVPLSTFPATAVRSQTRTWASWT